MALRRNSIFLAAALLAPLPALADDFQIYNGDPNYSYADRSDFISLSGGDALRSNLAIQHPTPWPSYVNKTKISTPAEIGTSALEKMFKRYGASAATTPSTVINIGSQ